MIDQVYSFVFKALLTEEALDKGGRISRLQMSPALDKDVADTLCLHLLDPDKVSRARRMTTAFTAITAFENSVRELIERKLLEIIGVDWWTKSVPEKIRKKAESRRDEESKIRWHSARGDSLLNYTEFGDLDSIIRNNWQHFEAHFRSIEWVCHIIDTLGKSRNVIMHSGDLQNDDFERIGVVIRDWVKQVGI